MQCACLLHEFAHVLIKWCFLQCRFQFVFYGIWLQAITCYSFPDYLFFLKALYLFCSYQFSLRLFPQQWQDTATDFEWIWKQPLEACSVQILKSLNCEKWPPDDEQPTQHTMRSTCRQTQGARSCSKGAGVHHLQLSCIGPALSPSTRKKGFELSQLMSLRFPHKTLSAKLSAEISSWSTELSPVTGSQRPVAKLLLVLRNHSCCQYRFSLLKR